MSKKILLPDNYHYNTYITGIGIGTFTGNAVFIFGGQLLVNKLNTNQALIQWIIGGIFTITAGIMLAKTLRRKESLPAV